MIQGIRTNPKDQDSHVLFFDVEALIGNVFESMHMHVPVINMLVFTELYFNSATNER